MGGMFPSTQPLVVFLPYPVQSTVNLTTGVIDIAREEDPANLYLYIYKPDGTAAYTGFVSGLSGPGSALSLTNSGIFVSVDPGVYMQGEWAFSMNSDVTATTNVNASAQWGGLADLIVQMSTQVDDLTTDMAVIKPQIAAINTQTQPGGTIFNNTAAARKALVNRWEVTDTTNPAAPVITVYEDDDVTPIGSRSVRNGDASNVSLAQVLNVGKVT